VAGAVLRHAQFQLADPQTNLVGLPYHYVVRIDLAQPAKWQAGEGERE
jgi:hypothetical protein